MPERSQSRHVVPTNFDNVVFKQWLRDKGADHRREVLRKLKEDLQNLGLSRRQVHRGLLQLMTKPLVVVTRHTACRRYGSKKLEECERSVDIETGCETDAAFVEHSPPCDNDRQTPDSMQRIPEEECKPTEKTERIKRHNEVSSSNQTYMSDKSCKLNADRTTLHSFDKVLEQLDLTHCTKVNVDKLNNRRTTVIVSTTDAIELQNKNYAMNNNSNTKSMYRDENQLKNINDDNMGVKPDTSDSIGNKDGRHRTTALKSPDTKQANYAKSDVQQEFDTSAKNTRVQVHRDKQFTEVNQENLSADKKSPRIDGNVDKRKVQETTLILLKSRKRICVSHDERTEHDRKIMKNIKYKLRSFFGDCRSISEDEQEQDILQRRFKRRRKKDSIDSCDSGVCFSESNGIGSSNGIEIIKDIQKAVPDSTMHEEINGDASSKKITSRDDVTGDKNLQVTDQNESFTDDKNKHSQNDTCNVEANIKSNMIEKELGSIFNVSNLVQSTSASDTTETSSEVVMSNINVLVSQETYVVNRASSCSTPLVPDSGRDINTTKDLPKSQTHTLDFRDLEELFDTGLNDSCHVTSNGNVLSIQEKIGTDGNQATLDKDTDLILLRMLLETELDCNQNIEQPAMNVANNTCVPLKDTKDSSSGVRKIESVPVKIDLRSLLGKVDGITLPKSKLSDTVEEKSSNILLTNSESSSVIEQRKETTVLDSKLNNETEKRNETAPSDSKDENKNTPFSQVPTFKLRVLSSAELGSRWCPTPVSVVISTTSQLPDTNTVTMSQAFSSSMTIQNVPMPIPVVSTGLPSGETTSSYNLKRSNTDPKFSEAVRSCLVNIYNLILNTRISRMVNSKPLFKEFENLKQILNARNYFVLIDGVINILNKELLQNQPLSLPELLHYIPSFKLLFRPVVPEQNNSSGHQNIPTIVSNETTIQNAYNTQGSQSVAQMEHVLQNVFSSFYKQTPAPANVISNAVQQNLKETVVVQQPNNLIQNNVPLNSITTNYGIPQVNYRMPAQRPILQPNIPANPYFIRQHPVSNIHAPQQGVPLQQFSPSLVNTNQSGIRYNQAAGVPTANKSVLYNCLSPNTFRPVNVPNHVAQQNMNQAQGRNMKNVIAPCMGYQFQNTVYRPPAYNVPQGVQLQNLSQLPQNIPVINNTGPIVQNTFVQSTLVPNIPQSVPRNVQTNEQVYQKTPVHPPRIPQYVISKQAPTGQQTQSTRKRQHPSEASIKSAMKQFHITKYLSEIQKIMLLSHVNFYFSCTTWLQQQFSFENWQIIRKQRSKLLHFQTLLNHLVEKTIKDLSSTASQPNVSENNTLTNSECNIPKTVQTVVQENERIRNQATKLNAEDQSKTLNINGCNVPRQESVNAVLFEKQSVDEQIVTDNLSNGQSCQTQKPETIVQGDQVQKTKQAEQILVQQNLAAISSILEMQTTSDNNINEKDASKKESGSCTDPYGSDTVPRAVLKEKLVIYDTKVPHKQSGVNLVTVEISSDSSEVTVVDVNDVSDSEDEEMRLVIVEPKEYEEPMEELEEYNKIKQRELKKCENMKQEEPKELMKYEEPKEEFKTILLKDNIFKTSEVDLLKTPKTEQSSEENTKNTSIEETIISHIADVRSITIEAFENMENSSEMPTNNTDENIEEEEVKVCSVCSKPSTVTCSVCLEAYYCSQQCYSLNWEEHYQDCKPVKRKVYS